ncbi:MAG: saccharopine dehydrogenase C-terminal domain-containing protein, partial [bacterium]|nr:saccharopine dehydrogenase C-terminal domain-containing protein [bacterium]
MVSTTQGNVLILGAGLVTAPMVEYLLSIPGVKVTVATRTVSKAEKLIGDHPDGTAQRLLSSDQEALHEAVGKSDVVVSLLPAPQHPIVAEHCFQLKKHLVTTSYVSDKMEAFHDQAKAAGLLFLNECGLDPGIDHMSAMKIIHQVHDEGGKVTGFRSLCGGLPAPEANNNPWGYKFSWSPKGVIRAGSNPGRFMIDKDTMDIPGKELFTSCERIDIHRIGEFECYPNRNSLPYVEKYQ